MRQRASAARSGPRRVVVLTHPEWIFHADFFRSVVRRAPAGWTIDEFVVIPRRPRRGDRYDRPSSLTGIVAAASHALRGLWACVALALTVRRFGIRVSRGESPNHPELVDRLTQHPPDVVFCAVDHFLEQPILNVPRIGCLNRHAGRLPDYRGVEPVFHALRNGEPSVTVTYHRMVEAIDAGEVVWERCEPVRPRDTVAGLYRRLFLHASEGFWPAVENLSLGQGRSIDIAAGSYYRRPTGEELDQFRARGRRYV